MKTVLVADDEQSVLYAVERAIKNEYTVLKASSGEEAVNLAKSHQPDVMLVDLLMPEKDGMTVCAEVQANESTKSIPVIMLTGVGHELNRKLAERVGFCRYMTKPFKPQELLGAISEILSVRTR